MLQATSQLWQGAWLLTTLGQYHGIVQTQLPDAVHLFQGVKRDLVLGDDKYADRRVLIYALTPPANFECRGGRDGVFPIPRPKPFGQVFTVLAIEYPEADAHGVSGSIEDFVWVREDARLAGAPVHYDSRYSKKVWSRK